LITLNKVSSARFFFYIALVGALLFSAESWLLGPLSWIYGYGSGLETIPTFKALSVDGRNFSLWSPFLAGGVDRLAFWGNANPIGPELFLFSIFPVWLANGLHRFLQYFIAIFFASLIAYEQIGLNKKWSSLTGILFGCFSYYTVGALFTLPGVPCILWLLSYAINKKNSITLVLVSACIVSLMTTFTFGVPYLLFFCILWFLFVRKPSWRRREWYRFSLFSIALVLLTSPQAIAIAFNASSSHRAHWLLEPMNMTWDGLFYRQLQFDLFAQDKTLMALTMNLPVIIFLSGLLLSIVCWRQIEEKPYAQSFLRITSLFFLLSQKWLWLGLQHVLSNLTPFLSGFYMGRFFEIPAPFLIALGFVLALHMFCYQIKDFRILWLVLQSIVSVLLLFMLIEPKIHLFYSLGVNDWGQANYQIPFIETLKKKNSKPFRVASVLPLQPAYAYAQGLESVDGWSNIYPERYREYWLHVLAPLFKEIPETQQIFGLKSGRAEDNFIFLGADLVRKSVGLLSDEDLTQALRTGFNIDRRFNLNLLRLINTKYLLSEYPLASKEIQLIHCPKKWPDSAQYRSRNTGLVEGEPSASMSKNPFTAAYEAGKRKLHGKDIFIYAIKNELDRFRFVEKLVFEPSAGAVMKKIVQSDIHTLRTSAILDASNRKYLSHVQLVKSGVIRIKTYQPDLIELDISLGGEGFLMIGNTWNPYWVGLIDGKKVRLYEANYIQSGMLIPSGSHRIVLKYNPPYNVYACYSSLLQR
jgi:hypothetical protein